MFENKGAELSMEHYHEIFQFSDQLLTVLKFILIIEAKTLLGLTNLFLLNEAHVAGKWTF